MKGCICVEVGRGKCISTEVEGVIALLNEQSKLM